MISTMSKHQPLTSSWENSLTFIYRKCIFWSLVICFPIVMDGYDGFLIPSFYAIPSFGRRFGVPLPDGSYTIETKWQTAFLVGAPIGRITGALESYGCKKVKLIPLILLSAVVFLVFFATNKSMLCAGWTISGLIWGVFNTMTPTYVPEICPVSLRSTFAAAINLSWVIGQLLAIAVITGPEPKPNDWPYPIPMAMQWVFPAVLIPIILFMSESSWWTLKQDDEQGSRKTLEQTIQEEDDSGKFSDCFRGTDLRRTEICCLSYSFQPLCGLYLLPYAAYFLKLTGIPQNVVFRMTLEITGLAVMASLVAPIIIIHFKRRTLYMGALAIMACTLFGMGITEIFDTPTAKRAAGVLIYVWVGTYDATVGPLTYVIESETSSMKTDMGAYFGFIYGPFCIVAIVWAYFRLPELKGMSFLE
ncbi:general substrate transporter [Yarrowia lipolytica]|nr:general substrate transporter [Yarrowia lipolytica]